MSVQHLHASRKHTKKTCVIAEEDSKEYDALMTMDTDGKYSVSPLLDRAIADAKDRMHRAEQGRRGQAT